MQFSLRSLVLLLLAAGPFVYYLLPTLTSVERRPLQHVIVVTTDGRIVSGDLLKLDEQTLHIRTADGAVRRTSLSMVEVLQVHVADP